ncbi:hypothetical protein JG687_00009924, partial [Phytophthora cactorum]
DTHLRQERPREPRAIERLSHIVVTDASILSVHHDTVTASAANAVFTNWCNVVGLLQLVGADQRMSNQSRFLRDTKIAEGENDERGSATLRMLPVPTTRASCRLSHPTQQDTHVFDQASEPPPLQSIEPTAAPHARPPRLPRSEYQQICAEQQPCDGKSKLTTAVGASVRTAR